MSAFDKLRQELTDSDIKVRLRALYQLGIIGDSSAVPDLQNVFQSDPSAELRPIAQAAIQHIQQTSSMTRQADAQADVQWTQEFVQYLETSTVRFTKEDIADLSAKVSEHAAKILSAYETGTVDKPIGQNALNPLGDVIRMAAVGNQGEVTAEGVYEMLWDCPYCGSEKLLGVTHRHCPNCGAAQDPDYRYFPEPGQEIALHDHQFVGVDLICPSCEGLNSAAATFCGNCGSSLENAQKASVHEAQLENEGFSSAKRDVAAERYLADLEMARQQSALNRGQSNFMGISRQKAIVGGGALLGLLAIILFGIYFFFIQTHPESVVVAGHEWERVIQIQVFDDVRYTGRECSGIPSAAYNVDRSTETRYRQVRDGETCQNQRVDQGDGSFRVERVCEPRYRDEPYRVEVCAYTVNEWISGREVALDGSGLNAQWPAFQLSAGSGGGNLGQERVGEEQEIYILKLERENGKIAECEFDDEDIWRSYADSDGLVIPFTRSGRPDCDKIERK